MSMRNACGHLGEGVSVLHPTNSKSHTETGPWFQFSSERLAKLVTPFRSLRGVVVKLLAL